MKAKRVDHIEERLIVAYYKECNSMAQTAEHFNRSKSTISLVVKKVKEKDPDFVSDIEQIKKQQNQDILNVLRNDSRVGKIVDHILDIMSNKDNLEAELKKKGLQPLTNAIGMLIDKALRYKSMNDSVDDNVILQHDDGFDKAVEKAVSNINAKDFIDKVSLTDVQ